MSESERAREREKERERERGRERDREYVHVSVCRAVNTLHFCFFHFLKQKMECVCRAVNLSWEP